jgi:hypothetical protein
MLAQSTSKETLYFALAGGHVLRKCSKYSYGAELPLKLMPLQRDPFLRLMPAAPAAAIGAWPTQTYYNP